MTLKALLGEISLSLQDNFSTNLRDDTLDMLYSLSRELSIPFDPLSSNKMEGYFLNLQKVASLEEHRKRDFFRDKIASDFRATDKQPEWIQGKDWQMSESGHPMLFIGQINLSSQDSPFHDSCCFYLFFSSSDGETKTVIQVD